MDDFSIEAKIILLAPVVLLLLYWIRGLIKDRGMSKKGYRHRSRWADPADWYEPDPKQKETLRSHWEARGYKWSEKYKRWYLPKSERRKTTSQRVEEIKRKYQRD